jgi:hypothetical protein
MTARGCSKGNCYRPVMMCMQVRLNIGRGKVRVIGVRARMSGSRRHNGGNHEDGYHKHRNLPAQARRH